ncbi:MAG TPA: PA14 domain-containing protein [Kofleriaceae bacterium]|nr:PA14 domain-containing protein [Kofleriaceae bacterium]
MGRGYLLLIAVAAGCGFKATQGAPDASLPGELPGELVPATWSFPGAAELAAPGHVAIDMTIDARGALTPAAYTYGGLVVRSQVNNRVWMHGQVSWAALDPTAVTGAGLWRGDPINTGSGLDYLGIQTKPTRVTLWFEGEVWLESGSSQQFELHGNDVAFIDLASPGSTAYAPLMESDATRTVPVPVTGWYPIRIGYSDGDASGDFLFRHSDGGGPMVPWSHERLRGRASELSGAFRTVFGHQIFGGGVPPAQLPVSNLEATDLLKATDFDTTPEGLGQEDWSARYAGQFYAAQAGAYTLQVTSDDGNRVRLGTVVKQTAWNRDQGVGFTPAVTTVTANLAEGWNDLAIDYNEVSGTRAMHAELQGPGLSGAAVPRALLRPVDAADDRLTIGADSTQQEIQNDGGPDQPATETVRFTGFTGETVSSIDVTFDAESDHWNQIRVDLEVPPGGQAFRRRIRDHENREIGGRRLLQIQIPAGTTELSALLGGSSTGDFKLHVYDDAPGGNHGTLHGATITLHTTGGPERVARTASWTSPVLDAATAVHTIDGIVWDQRLPEGAGLEVHVRTCQQAGCSDDPAWSPPVAPSAAVAVAPGRYLQVRVDMTSNGLVEPELRGLAVMYRRDS